MRKSQAPSLSALLRLNQRLLEIVQTDFANLSPEALCWQAQAETWSLAQCLEHMRLFLQGCLPLLAKAAQKGKPLAKAQNHFSTGFWAEYQLARVQLSADNRPAYPAHSPKAWQPSPQTLPNFPALFDAWAELLGWLQKAAYLPLAQIKLRLPGLGPLRIHLGNALHWLSLHLERHVVQAQRIRLLPEFPAAQPTSLNDQNANIL